MLVRFITFILKSVFSTLWYCFAVTIVVAAVAISGFRFAAPLINSYSNHIETWVAQAVGKPVRITEMDAYWRGLNPSVRLKNLSLLSEDGSRTFIAFDEADISIDLISSLRYLQFRPGSLSINGVNLNLASDAQGGISLVGFHTRKLPRNAAQSPRVLNWVFRQRRLQLNNVNVVWHQKQNDEIHRFSDVQLELRNSGSRHILTGHTRLPESLGKRLNFALDLIGPGVDVRKWVGKIYLRCIDCSLTAANRLLPDQSPWRIGGGGIDYELWAQWNGRRIGKAEGNVHIRRPQLAGQKQAVLTQLNGRFAWRKHRDKWQLLIEELSARFHNKTWPESRLIVEYQKPFVHVTSGFLRLDELADAFIALPGIAPPLKQLVGDRALKGDILGMRTVLNLDNPKHFYINADILDFSMNAWRHIPQVKGADGSIAINERAGLIRADSDDVTVYWDKLFRDAVQFDRAAGVVAWRKIDDHQWLVASDQFTAQNGPLQTHGHFSMRRDKHHRQGDYVDLGLNFESGDIGGAKQFLSFNPLAPALAEHIDNIVKAGKINGGGLIYRGRVKNYPFTEGEGKFLVQTDVNEARVHYADHWPELHNVEAAVTFNGQTLRVEKAKGQVYDAQFRHGLTVISDIKNNKPVLTASGVVHASTQEAVQFLTETPLKHRFETYLAGSDTNGRTSVDLELSMALKGIPKPDVKGWISMRESMVDMHALGVKIDDINGHIRFHNEKINAKNLKAQLWEMPGEFNIHTEQAGKHTYTIIAGKGQMDIPRLNKRFNLPVFQYAEGASRWDAVLRVRQASLDVFPKVNLQLQSNLQGIKIDLPDPLGKTHQERRRLYLENLFTATSGHTLRMNYEGGNLHGIFYAENSPDGIFYERGELRFGGSPAQVPPNRGLRLTGFIAKLSTTEWGRALFDKSKTDQSIYTNQDMINLINRVDISIQEAETMGFQFHDMHLNAIKSPGKWRARITSAEAEGAVDIPLDVNQSPLTMTFSRLHLKPAGKRIKSETDPRYLPAIEARVDEFRYDGNKIGGMVLSVVKQPPGLEIEKFQVDSDIMDIEMQGRWFVINGKQKSQLYAAVTSDNLGHVLERFGYVNALSAGKSRLIMDFHWPGPPSNAKHETIEGDLSLEITDGSLLEVDPGAGRLFGLFSWQALPRRLALDFSDFFQKGFRFDVIRGDFTLNRGDAYTGNLIIEGPAALVEVAGRVGLVDKDYDQYVTVIPSVGSNLPWLGWLASGEPHVGAVIFVTQKIFDSQIKNITRYTYSMRGPWDNPVIKPVKPINNQTSLEEEDVSELN